MLVLDSLTLLHSDVYNFGLSECNRLKIIKKFIRRLIVNCVFERIIALELAFIFVPTDKIKIFGFYTVKTKNTCH